MKYCCNEMENWIKGEVIEHNPTTHEWFITYDEVLIFEIDYCPFCGQKLKP